MSTITLECEVTEIVVIPPLDQERVGFCVYDECLVISFVGEENTILTQSEIEKKDAIELAKLILMKYK